MQEEVAPRIAFLLAVLCGDNYKPVPLRRLQSLVFILQVKWSGDGIERYHFKLTPFGPRSDEILEDINLLMRVGAVVEVRSYGERKLSVTRLGEEWLRELARRHPSVRELSILADFIKASWNGVPVGMLRRYAEKLYSVMSSPHSEVGVTRR